MLVGRTPPHYAQFARLQRHYRRFKHYTAKYKGPVTDREEYLKILALSGKRVRQLGLEERAIVSSYYGLFSFCVHALNVVCGLLQLRTEASSLDREFLMRGVLACLNWLQVLRFLQHIQHRYMINHNLKEVGFWIVTLFISAGPFYIGWTFLELMLYRNISEWNEWSRIAEDYMYNLFQYSIYETFEYSDSLLFKLLYAVELFFVLMIGNNIMLAIFISFSTEAQRIDRVKAYLQQAYLICP
jgi:hypothetical protein